MAIEIEIISAVLGIAGGILNVYKNKWGFAVWIVGNFLWVYYGLATKQYFFMLQYIVFVSISMWGFRKWYNDELMEKKRGRNKIKNKQS